MGLIISIASIASIIAIAILLLGEAIAVSFSEFDLRVPRILLFLSSSLAVIMWGFAGLLYLLA